MKTPHRIKLYIDKGTPKYNPITGEYDQLEGMYKVVPCFVNAISQSKVFEEYGDRTQKIIVCRFNQEQGAFVQAEYKGELYEPVEAIDAPIKGSVRLRKVVE